MQADQGIYQILRNQTKNVGILKYSLSSLVVGCHDCSQANQNNYQNVLSWDRLGKCIIKHVSYIHTDRCLYICMYTSMNIQNLILGFKPTKRKRKENRLQYSWGQKSHTEFMIPVWYFRSGVPNFVFNLHDRENNKTKSTEAH